MPQSIRIRYSTQIDGKFLMLPVTELVVEGGEAVAYGLVEETDPEGTPVVLDAVVAAHQLFLGDAFTPETCDEYLGMQAKHWLGRAFGQKAFFSGYTINGHYAYDLASPYKKNKGYKGLSFDRARIQDDDLVEVFSFQDSDGMDYYTYFRKDEKTITELNLHAGETVEIELEGLMFGYGGPMTRKDRKKNRLLSTVSDAQLVTVDTTDGSMTPIADCITDDDGLASISFDEAGIYYVSCQGGECRYTSHIALPWLKVTVD